MLPIEIMSRDGNSDIFFMLCGLYASLCKMLGRSDCLWSLLRKTVISDGSCRRTQKVGSFLGLDHRFFGRLLPFHSRMGRKRGVAVAPFWAVDLCIRVLLETAARRLLVYKIYCSNFVHVASFVEVTSLEPFRSFHFPVFCFFFIPFCHLSYSV